MYCEVETLYYISVTLSFKICKVFTTLSPKLLNGLSEIKGNMRLEAADLY